MRTYTGTVSGETLPTLTPLGEEKAMKRQSLSPSSTLQHPSRREFLVAAAGSALAGAVIPRVHAADNHTLQIALVGCGGRGTGAIHDALNTASLGPVKLVAMADVFEAKLKRS